VCLIESTGLNPTELFCRNVGNNCVYEFEGNAEISKLLLPCEKVPKGKLVDSEVA
jgi:hypothetical protein